MVIICKLVHKAKNSKRQMDERTDGQTILPDGRTNELTNQPMDLLPLTLQSRAEENRTQKTLT